MRWKSIVAVCSLVAAMMVQGSVANAASPQDNYYQSTDNLAMTAYTGEYSCLAEQDIVSDWMTYLPLDAKASLQSAMENGGSWGVSKMVFKYWNGTYNTAIYVYWSADRLTAAAFNDNVGLYGGGSVNVVANNYVSIGLDAECHPLSTSWQHGADFYIYVSSARPFAQIPADPTVAGGVANLFLNYPVNYPAGYEGATIPSTYTPSTPRYVAMGDSFSSGEGNPPFMYGTDTSTNKCHRSSQAYPRLLQDDSSLNLGPTAFVACSGATMNDVLGIAESNDPKGKWNESVQIDALSADTAVVTITIGGNDIGFTQFATACTVASCDVHSPPYATITGKINSSFQNSLSDVYGQILQLSGSAKLIVLGYPYIAGDSYNGDCMTFDYANDEAARIVTEALNQRIHDAVDDVKNDTSHPSYASRISFVSANSTNGTSPFDGRYVCDSNSYFVDLDFINQEYSYHPNGSGHQAYKQLVVDALN